MPVDPILNSIQGTGSGGSNTTGWMIFIAAMGMTLGLLGSEFAALSTFTDALTPAFVGKAFVHISTVIGAFMAGKIITPST